MLVGREAERSGPLFPWGQIGRLSKENEAALEKRGFPE
jgi:hypothetical protein